jgi:hypothetical protein
MLPGTDQPVVFYCGKTNNPARREREHLNKSKHTDDDTNKYVLIRELDSAGIKWELNVIVEDINGEPDSEYEFVLMFARHNRRHGIGFIDGSPLTNLKMGDHFSEIIDRLDINTTKDIREWRMREKVPRTRRLPDFDTWTARDQASAIYNLLKRMLRFYGVKENELGAMMREHRRGPATPTAMIRVLLRMEPDEDWGEAEITTYLYLLDEAAQLGINP